MTITLSAVVPDLTLDFNVRHGEVTPGPVSQYSKPVVSMRQGQSLVLQLHVKDGSGVAVNISTYTTINWAMFLGQSTSAALSKTGALVSSGTTGIFTVTLAPGDTDDVTPGVYQFEIQVKGTNMKNTLVDGAVLTLLARHV